MRHIQQNNAKNNVMLNNIFNLSNLNNLFKDYYEYKFWFSKSTSTNSSSTLSENSWITLTLVRICTTQNDFKKRFIAVKQ